jgi:hypothetical protein
MWYACARGGDTAFVCISCHTVKHPNISRPCTAHSLQSCTFHATRSHRPAPLQPRRRPASPCRLLGSGPLPAQQVQHLHAEEGELAVLNELTQVGQARLARIRDVLPGGAACRKSWRSAARHTHGGCSTCQQASQPCTTRCWHASTQHGRHMGSIADVLAPRYTPASPAQLQASQPALQPSIHTAQQTCRQGAQEPAGAPIPNPAPHLPGPPLTRMSMRMELTMDFL